MSAARYPAATDLLDLARALAAMPTDADDAPVRRSRRPHRRPWAVPSAAVLAALFGVLPGSTKLGFAVPEPDAEEEDADDSWALAR